MRTVRSEERRGWLRRDLGAAIRRRRELLGLSPADLARMSNLSRQYVALVETGERLPSLKALDSLANALQTRMGDLLDESLVDRDPVSPNVGASVSQLVEQINVLVQALMKHVEQQRG